MITPATAALHEQLIRLAKGAIKVWETWLDAERLAPRPHPPQHKQQ